VGRRRSICGQLCGFNHHGNRDIFRRHHLPGPIGLHRRRCNRDDFQITAVASSGTVGAVDYVERSVSASVER
jgi:hypothetical protein